MSQPKPSEKIIKFVETYCRVPEGALVGQPIQLLEFQKKFIRDVYDNVDENGERITRRAYLSLGRKNGKTALIACLLLAHVCGPERVRNSQIVCGARSREQASVIFNLACKIINFSPELTRVTRIVPSSKRIIGLKDNVEFKALAAEGSKNLGLSVLVGIIDEIGAVRGPTDSFVESITTAQGAHKTPLLQTRFQSG
jgi:phage terminase large subunit-like protein